jgi:transposase
MSCRQPKVPVAEDVTGESLVARRSRATLALSPGETAGPTGKTPWLLQRTRVHQKVSVVAALCSSPSWQSVRLYFRLHPNSNICTRLVIAFLRNLLLQLKGNVVLIWDLLPGHRATKVQNLIHKASRIHSYFLPPYAPELNPLKYVWGYLKNNSLANAALPDTQSLRKAAHSRGQSLQRKQKLLMSFLRHSPLFFMSKIGHY